MIDTKKLQNLLNDKELSQSEFSRRSGVPQPTLSLVLKTGACSLINAKRIALALGVKIDDLLKIEQLPRTA